MADLLTAARNPLHDLWLSCGFVKQPFGGWDSPDFRYSAHALRRDAVQKFSWAIPSQEAIAWIAERCNRVVEIGAGRGYWAALLSEAGVDVVAYEPTAVDGEIRANVWMTLYKRKPTEERG